MSEWKTNYCRYVEEDETDNVKVTTLDYSVTVTIDEHVGKREGRVDVTGENRTYTLPALMNVPEHVMTGWVQGALGPEKVASLEEDAIPIIEDEIDDSPTGGFEPE